MKGKSGGMAARVRAVPADRAALIVVAAGQGARLGRPEHKALAPLAGRLLVEHALATLLDLAWLDPVVLVGHADDVQELERLVAKLPRAVRVVAGGARRQDSVAAGLDALVAPPAPTPEWVLIHDAARPFPPCEALAELLTQAHRRGAALLAWPVSDTIKLARQQRDASGTALVERTVPRDVLWSAQTPQAFRRVELRALLRDAESRGAAVTDEAALYESSGREIALVPGSPLNFKVTTPQDLELAHALLMASGR
ncbi:MAG: 2-C-methyl-D-erythritol 4-phosphate cytidylyltransferase [Planctomycetota bacterium]